MMVFVLTQVHLPTHTQCTAEISSAQSKHRLLAWSLGSLHAGTNTLLQLGERPVLAMEVAGAGVGQLPWGTFPGCAQNRDTAQAGLCCSLRSMPGALAVPGHCCVPPAHCPSAPGTGLGFARPFLEHIADSSSGGEQSLPALPSGDAFADGAAVLEPSCVPAVPMACPCLWAQPGHAAGQ